MSRRYGWIGGASLAAALSITVGPAAAQKVPGATIPVAPDATYQPVPPPRAVPVPPARPGFVPRPPPSIAPGEPPQAGAERDAEARQLAARLPLDPAVANLQGRMPPDVRGTVNRLGLRVPNGGRTDLRNQPITREDVINALRH